LFHAVGVPPARPSGPAGRLGVETAAFRPATGLGITGDVDDHRANSPDGSALNPPQLWGLPPLLAGCRVGLVRCVPAGCVYVSQAG